MHETNAVCVRHLGGHHENVVNASLKGDTSSDIFMDDPRGRCPKRVIIKMKNGTIHKK